MTGEYGFCGLVTALTVMLEVGGAAMAVGMSVWWLMSQCGSSVGSLFHSIARALCGLQYVALCRKRSAQLCTHTPFHTALLFTSIRPAAL